MSKGKAAAVGHTLTRRIGRDGRIIPRQEKAWGEYEWQVELEFTPVGEEVLRPSRLVLERGTFYDSPPPEGITARLLRAIKFGELVDEFNREHLGDLAAGDLFFGRSAEPAYQLPPRSNRPGPRGWGEDFYVAMAQAYLEAVRIDRRRPIDVMLSFYPGFPKATLRDCVYRTRLKGYLQKLGRGRSGGLPTEKLLEALRARGMVPPGGSKTSKNRPKGKPSRKSPPRG